MPGSKKIGFWLVQAVPETSQPSKRRNGSYPWSWPLAISPRIGVDEASGVRSMRHIWPLTSPM